MRDFLAVRNRLRKAICLVITKHHPAAKGVRQEEFGKKVTKKVTEASEKVTEK